jgi:fused signal recognition particle receptor
MGAVEIGLLVLLAFVFVFGVGVIIANRRQGTALPPSATPVERTSRAQAPAKSGTILEEREAAEAGVVEVESEPIEIDAEPAPGTLRDRLAKARSTFSGAIAGVLGRSGITDESFEDLEEALLRVMYELPTRDDVARCIIDEKVITERAEPELVTGTRRERQMPRRAAS